MAERIANIDRRRHPLYQYYLWGVVGLGALAIAHCCWQMMRDGGLTYQWVILASLTMLTGTFTVKIPGVNSKISVADTFVFTNLIMFGPYVGGVTAALDGFTGSIRANTSSRRLQYTAFNTSAMAVSAFLAGKVFFALLGQAPLVMAPQVTLQQALLPAAVLAVVHYLTNSTSVAVIVALDSRRRVFKIWRESFLWTSITYFTCATIAALISVNLNAPTLLALGWVLPVLIVIYFSYRTHRDKVEEQTHRQELSDLYMRTVETLALAVDAKDQTTHGHIRRVRAYAVGLMKLSGVSDSDELMAIETGSLLHDIGKLAIDDYILNKPGKLSKQEFDKMKTHAAAGDEILRQIQFPFPVATYVRSHHERWDGQGYPDGLKGEEIPLGARIIALADSFDAARSSRPYKTSAGIEETLAYLETQAGKAYDPNLMRLLRENVEELEASAIETTRNLSELSFRLHEKTGLMPAEVPSMVPSYMLPPSASAELMSLHGFCSILGRHFSLPDILVNLECRIKRLVPFTTCAFYLNNGDETLTVTHAGGKHAEAIDGLTLGMGKGISGWVAAYQKPMINTIPILEFEGLKGGGFEALTDALVVPMLIDGGCIGTISLYAQSPIFYSQVHLEFMQTVAKEAGPLLAEVRRRHTSAAGEDMAARIDRDTTLQELGSDMIAESVKHGTPFCLLFLEIKNLDQLVYLFGEADGSSALMRAEEVLRSRMRKRDILVPYGEHGFIILLAGVDRGLGSHLAQQFLLRVRNIPVGKVASDNVYIVGETGVASYPGDGSTIFDLLEVAQAGLAEKVKMASAGLQTEEVAKESFKKANIQQ